MTGATKRRLVPRPTAADGGVVALVGLLCAFIVLGTAGATAWLRVTADEMAAQVFGDAPASGRQLQVFYSETRDAEVPAEAGAALEETLAPSLSRLLQPPRHAVVTREAVMEALPKQPQYSPSYLSVVGFPDARSLVDVVEGRFPEPGHRMVTLPAVLAASYDGPRRVPIVEVALEREAAEAMDTAVGTYLDLVPLRYNRDATGALPLLRVSGIYEPAPGGRSQLDDVDNARRPAISTLPEFTVVRAAGLAADDRTVLQAPWAFDPEVRWTFDSQRLPTAAEAEAVVDDSRRLAVQPWPPVVESASSAAVTGLGELGSTFVAERAASDTLARLVLAALAAAAFALLLAGASVLEARRREVTDVLRARGAGTGRLAVTRAGEAVLVTLPGLLVAAVLVPVTPLVTTDLVPALLAAAVCVLMLTVAQVAAWRRLPERVRLPAGDALQIVVVALALGLVALMWRRDRLDASDPLLLLLPVLLGVAGAVVVVRGVRVLAGLLRRLAGRGSRVAPIVGASQAGTTAQHVMLPVVALVLAGCSALLAAAVDDSIARGAERAAWEELGADARVTAGEFDVDAQSRLEELPGVDEVAAVYVVQGLLDTPTGSEQVTVIGVDPSAFSAVTEVGPDPVPVPHPAGERLGAVASSDLAMGEIESTLRYAQATMPLSVTAEVDEIPGLGAGEAFVVVDAQALRTASERSLMRAQTLLVAGSPDPGELRRVVHEAWPTAKVRTGEEVRAQSLEEPVSARALLAANVSAVVSVLLALFAAGLAVARGRPLRRRTLSVLHQLGGDARQGRWVTALEMMPSMAGAGLAAGVAVLLLLTVAGSGIDLAAITGGSGAFALALDPMSWTVAISFLVGIVLLTAAAAGWGVRATDDVRTAHEGETR